MKLLLFLLILSCSGSAWCERTPFQARCEDTIRKTVSVIAARQNGYTVDNSVSFHALTGWRGRADARMFVLGVTRTESRVSVSMEGQMLQDRTSGYECVAPHVQFTLDYSPIKLYVGSEFPPGSCGYKEILAHEMRHLNTYLDHLPKVEAVVRNALASRFQDKPLYAPAGQASALLAREINSGWLPFIKGEMGRVEAQQAAIDSPQEYERLSRVCKGEVQSIIRTAQRTRR